MIEGWKKVQVLEICTKGSSNIAQNKIEDNFGEYPLYGASGFLKKIDFYHQEKPYIGIVKDGSGVGRVGFYPAKSSLLGTLQYILPKEGYDIRFVGYALKSLDLASFSTGAAIPHIYFKDYGKSFICVPPTLEEQERVVNELDLLTGIIDKKNAQLRDLDTLVDSLFYEMFGEAEVNQKGFPLLTVDDVIQFQGGSQPDKKYFEYEPTEGNVRLIQIRDYKTDRYITYVPKELARRFCTEDDIMIGRYGPPIFQILKGISGAYNVALMKAVPKQGNKDFIRVFLKQKRLLHYLESFSRRVAGQDGIQMDKLKAYPFPFPPMELQNRFAKQYHEIEKQKLVVSQSMAECESLLSSRMSHYFD